MALVSAALLLAACDVAPPAGGAPPEDAPSDGAGEETPPDDQVPSEDMPSEEVPASAPSEGEGGAEAPGDVAVDGHPEGWDLVFSDEFDGATLDRDKWCTRYAYGGGAGLQEGYEDASCLPGTLDTLSGNGEAQVYRDVNELGEELHVVRDGHLELNATHTAAEQHHQFGIEYESSMIRSKQEFAPTAERPLYFAARIRMPDVYGTWPAWWLNPGLGDDDSPGWPPEIDIVEGPLNNAGEGAGTFFVNTHGSAANGLSTGGDGSFSRTDEALFDAGSHHYTGAGGSIRDQWLTVAFRWRTDEICWSVLPDGEEQVVDFACQEGFRWVSDDGDPANPASILFNLALGGWGANHDNATMDPAGFPGFDSGQDVTSFDIDFVRVYAPAG